MMLRAGKSDRPPLPSAISAFHAISGSGVSTINGARRTWGPKHTFAAPPLAEIADQATGADPAFRIRIRDAPLQEKLGYCKERARA